MCVWGGWGVGGGKRAILLSPLFFLYWCLLLLRGEKSVCGNSLEFIVFLFFPLFCFSLGERSAAKSRL